MTAQPLATATVTTFPLATATVDAALLGTVAPYPAPDTGQAQRDPSPATATPTPDATVRAAEADALWLSPEELAQLPMQGPAWQQLQTVADQSQKTPDIYDKDDDGDVFTLARALVYARTGQTAYREAVVENLQAVMGQEIRPGRTSILAVARNLPAYVIAADLVELWRDEALDGAFRDWLRLVSATEFSGDGGAHTIAGCHETRPNNFGSHCGAARLAIALYLHDEQEVERAADVFHGWLGNRDAYANFDYGRLSWQANPEQPVGINPPGTVKQGQHIGGALPEEMRRGGDFRWPPKRTGYVWEALQGALVQAELLSRAGYPAWQWEEQALLRAASFLYELGWEANGDDTWQPWLLNYAYGTDFPTTTPARPGKNMGWTDWTHGAARLEANAPASRLRGQSSEATQRATVLPGEAE